MDMLTFVLSIVSGFILFIMILSLDNIMSGTKKEKREVLGIFALLIFLICSPFIVNEIDHDIKYKTTTEKQLVKLVDGVSTYKEKCSVKLVAHIPLTIGMYDEEYEMKPFDNVCIDLTDEDYAEIEKHISYFKTKIDQKD